jgi:uncharacterized protein DUF5989
MRSTDRGTRKPMAPLLRLRHLGRLFVELVDLARTNRLYWPLAMVALLVVLSVAVVVGQAAAPLIYALF